MDIEFDHYLLMREDAERLRELFRLSLPSTFSDDGLVSETYRTIAERMERRPGYPRLYLWAWRLLIYSRERRDSNTLSEIYSIHLRLNLTLLDQIPLTTTTISLWHLKSILYCWFYLPTDGSFSIEERRPRESVNELVELVLRGEVFMNLLPVEAEKKLAGCRISNRSIPHLKPFLFRLSSTYPGLFILSYKGPVSDRYYHQYIKSPEDFRRFLSLSNTVYPILYAKVVEKKTGGEQRFITSQEMLEWMKDPLLDRGMSREEIDTLALRLQQLLPNKRKRLIDPNGDNGYSLLLSSLSLSELHCTPRDQTDSLNLDGSYLHSYGKNSSNIGEILCSHCQTEDLREPRLEKSCNRIYCSENCFQESIDRVY